VVLCKILYEYDAWPAPTNYYEKTINGAEHKLRYRSYQTAYHRNTFTTLSGNRYGLRTRTSGSLNNSDIKYNYK